VLRRVEWNKFKLCLNISFVLEDVGWSRSNRFPCTSSFQHFACTRHITQHVHHSHRLSFKISTRVVFAWVEKLRYRAVLKEFDWMRCICTLSDWFRNDAIWVSRHRRFLTHTKTTLYLQLDIAMGNVHSCPVGNELLTCFKNWDPCGSVDFEVCNTSLIFVSRKLHFSIHPRELNPGVYSVARYSLPEKYSWERSLLELVPEVKIQNGGCPIQTRIYLILIGRLS